MTARSDNRRPLASPEAPSSPLLPPELPWLYMVVPLPAAYLMGHSLFDQSPAVYLPFVIKTYAPFVVFGATFHFVYRYLMPRLLPAIRTAAARAVLHVVMMLVVVCLVAVGLVPLLGRLMGGRVEPFNFVVISTIFSASMLFPALALQRQRTRARSAEHAALMERKAALQAQLSALQARTDPHFLFNSINTVASLIPENPELAERTLERLADLFRYALESGRVRTVKLERELAMVSDYLELQSTRFGDRLETRLSVASGLGDIDVPPLLLQPLVENAILHGTSRRSGGRVDISVRREHDTLVIDVSDDGPGPGQSSHAGSGTAVSGVAERLRLLFSERASVSLSAPPGGGCLAQLTLPIASTP